MNLKFYLPTIILILTGSLTWAGANGSGGGMGVVCKDSNGEIESVELLDLWEARVIYNRKIIESDEPIETQVESGLQNLKHAIYVDGYSSDCNGNSCKEHGPEAYYRQLYSTAYPFLDDFNPNVRRLRGVQLSKTNDSLEMVRPTGQCSIEQLVRYIDTAYGGEILINQDLLDRMSNTQLSALYIHEAFYASIRTHFDFSEKSSLRIRRSVGLIYSGFQFPSWEKFLPKEYYDCRDEKNRALIYLQDSLDGKKIVYAHVIVADKRPMIGVEYPNSGIVVEDPESAGRVAFSWAPMNRAIGYDYTVMAKSFVENNEIKMRLQLISAPDQEREHEMVKLSCFKSGQKPHWQR